MIGANAITVSTLQETEYFAAAGYTDILYAVSIVAARMDQVLALNARDVNVQVLLDSPETAVAVAQAAAAKDEVIEAWIEVDVDGHRAGLEPDDPQLVEIGQYLQDTPSTRLAGVLTHAGGAYQCRTLQKLEQHAEQDVRVQGVGQALQLVAAVLHRYRRDNRPQLAGGKVTDHQLTDIG